ncbi:3'-5' exonuclease [Chrysiogenes arsenatis]|uniref:3'-5' exonuclease n=1 Tax=Chrysiogenes arsenatis TaxID=309797 RepID=UPI000403942A|nr:3'-5' exonuclease [Chrysiogenes arsenatis]
MFDKIKTHFNRKRLKDEQYAFLFEPYTGNEVVSFDCETTGLNPNVDEIISIGAVKIRDNTVLMSEKLELFLHPRQEISAESIRIHHILTCDLDGGVHQEEGVKQFLHFIGNRPLIGYYLEFDVAMINKVMKPLLGINLPNKQIEVSGLYYDKKIAMIPQGNVDLRFDSIMTDLGLPALAKHNAVGDAVMTALMYIKLQKVRYLDKGR